jgi:hypothetical protein
VKYKYRPTNTKNWAEIRQNRRIIQEYGIEEANKTGALDSTKENRIKDKMEQKQKTKETKDNNSDSGLHIGVEFQVKYDEFIKTGGDPDSCPFD